MSHPLCYTYSMIIKNDMREQTNRMRYDEGLDSEEIANYENKHDIIHYPGFVSEDDETYYGCDTITAPDGKEYPIRDRD